MRYKGHVGLKIIQGLGIPKTLEFDEYVELIENLLNY